MKTLFALSLCCVAVCAQTPVTSPEAVNPVVAWNRILLTIVRTPGAQPATIHPTRSFAILHAAIYDAVNAIEKDHRPYLAHHIDIKPGASPDAAANSAAHEVLVTLYPSQRAALDQQFKQMMAQIPNGKDKIEGFRIGYEVADRLLVARLNDGASAPPVPYVFGVDPGNYQATPPNFPAQPQFTHWFHVSPFVLARADQFRPGPPPSLSSERYSRALAAVESLGNATGTMATEDQALTGRFWNGAIQNYWNEIAQSASIARNLSTAENARLFALLNFSIADSVIAFYDAKYTYNFWRPVTAIRAADPNETPNAQPDPNWLPEVGNTPPDPSYPGAHAVISAAASFVLIDLLGSDCFEYDVTSEVLPGITHHFTSFSAAAKEASESRVFAGVHFQFGLTAGARLGHNVADFIVASAVAGRK